MREGAATNSLLAKRVAVHLCSLILYPQCEHTSHPEKFESLESHISISIMEGINRECCASKSKPTQHVNRQGCGSCRDLADASTCFLTPHPSPPSPYHITHQPHPFSPAMSADDSVFLDVVSIGQPHPEPQDKDTGN